MSGESGRPPLDIVKVEVEEEEDGTGGLGPGTVEGVGEDDKDLEMVKSVASLLGSGPWLSCGSEEGERLGRKLLDLGEKLEGWKEWERLCRLKQKKNRDLCQRLEGAELRVEMMKGSKEELRKTYDVEVDRKIKAELEVAELRKKAGELVDPVLNEVGVQTEASNEMVLQEGSVHGVLMVTTAGMGVGSWSAESSPEDGEQLQEDQDDTSSSSEICDEDNTEDLAETEKNIAVAPDPIASSSGTSYNLRRRSVRENRNNAMEERVELESDEDCDDDAGDKDEPPTATIAFSRAAPQRTISNHRIPISSLSGRQRFECGRCEAILSTKGTLDRHLKNVHAKEVHGNFFCYVCNKRFLHKSNFSQHLRTHPWNQSYKCKTCNKILKNRTSFQAHMEIHKPNRERKFVCPTCSIKLFTSSALSSNMVVHRPEKPFKCPQCPKRFKFPGKVKLHLVTHSEVMPFPCELCEKRFKRSHDLVKHVRTHTRERPYSCQTCQKTFTNASNLSSHMRIHQGEEGKSHQCPFCDMKFSWMSNCRRHQQIHHKSELAALAETDSKMEK